jgi:hypothetical protein
MSTQRQVRRTTEEFLDRNPVFSRSMFAEAHGEVRLSTALAKRLKYLQSRERIVSLERGLYATVRPGDDPEALAPDPYLVGAALRPDGVFAYHSALTLLGAGHSDWGVVTLLSHSRRRPLVLRGTRVEVLPHPATLVYQAETEIGVRSVPYLDRTLRVTGPERTLVDGFRRLDLVGGFEELVASAAGFPSLDFEKLDAVLYAYGLQNLYAGVGWFLETYQGHFFVPDDYLERMEERRPAAPQYLPRRGRTEDGRGRMVSRWNVILPEAVVDGTVADEP